METKHTPGPWFMETWSKFNGEQVTQVSAFSEYGNRTMQAIVNSGNSEANARLIAAAPDLLEALKEIVSAADGDGWNQLDAGLRKARAAIAKATGVKE